MAKSYTQYYRLCQWEPEDKFMRTEFNQDNQRLDEALEGLSSGKADKSEVETLRQTVAAKGRVTAGYYDGTGDQTRHIELGFAPVAVLVERIDGMRHASGNYGTAGGLAVRGGVLFNRDTLVSVTSTGFYVHNCGEFSGGFNGKDVRYYYVAWG